MTKNQLVICIFAAVLSTIHFVLAEDRPCIPRYYGDSSVVCVCNATYCDDVSSVEKIPGHYVYYTSTKSGKRFEKSSGTFKPYNAQHKTSDWLTDAIDIFLDFDVTLEVKRNRQFQTVEGFGGGLSDSAAANIMKLSKETQENLMNSYFASNGIEYEMVRISIGGSDYSERAYAYNMEPEGDKNLSNFTLTFEDTLYKIPLIKKAKKLSPRDVLVSAAVWSPPLWMKTVRKWGGENRLKPEYYQTYADYHLRFVEEYKKHGIDIWSISTGNEPTTGIVPIVPINTLGWIPSEQGKWVAENLGPIFRNSSYSDIKILALEDQRVTVPIWIDIMATYKDALKYIDGIALHWYNDALIDASLLDETHKRYPDKFLISTEGSSGSTPFTSGVLLGSWERGEFYMEYIIEDLQHWIAGWIDWNMVLNRSGGPSWIDNHVDSPIIALHNTDEFLKQPTFYAMGHFSKFIPRGSIRVHVKEVKGTMHKAAFLRPDGGIAMVFFNPNPFDKTVIIREKHKGSFTVEVPPRSFQTVVYW